MSIKDCSRLALVAAMGLQARADKAPQSVASIMDAMADYGIRLGIDPALWRTANDREVREAIEELRERGFVSYHAGGLYKLAHGPVPVKHILSWIGPSLPPFPPGISIETKRATLEQLARIMHPEIAEVLDAILVNDLRPA